MSSEVISFLSRPETYGGSCNHVERIETALSDVFLAGNLAFKLKRPVRLAQVDYSTLERRQRFCEREVDLNRRTAAMLYVGAIPVKRDPSGALALGGVGEVVDWLVEMHRFDQHMLFEALAARGGLEPSMMDAAGRAVANLHGMAARRPEHGGAAALRLVLDDNQSALTGGAGLDAGTVERLFADTHEAVKRHTMLLETRRADGWVRAGHGDLRLRNICLIDGRPVLFDAIEFNDRLSCVDVLYDLALLLVDLLHRDLRVPANIVLNTWMDRLRQHEAMALLPLFMSLRATTSAAVFARTGSTSDAQSYLADAVRLLEPGTGAILAIGGLAGAGKTTLVNRLAATVGAAPGGVVLRAESGRQRLFGVVDDERRPPPAYDPSAARSIYRLLAREAHDVARAGYVAVVDATLGLEEWRRDIERTAERAGVPLVGVWLDVPIEMLEQRVRQSRGAAADAAIRVLRQQHQAAVVPDDWVRLDATADPEQVLDAATTAWLAAQSAT